MPRTVGSQGRGVFPRRIPKVQSRLARGQHQPVVLHLAVRQEAMGLGVLERRVAKPGIDGAELRIGRNVEGNHVVPGRHEEPRHDLLEDPQPDAVLVEVRPSMEEAVLGHRHLDLRGLTRSPRRRKLDAVLIIQGPLGRGVVQEGAGVRLAALLRVHGLAQEHAGLDGVHGRVGSSGGIGLRRVTPVQAGLGLALQGRMPKPKHRDGPGQRPKGACRPASTLDASCVHDV